VNLSSTPLFGDTWEFHAFGYDPTGTLIVLADSLGLCRLDLAHNATQFPTAPDLDSLALPTEPYPFHYSALAVSATWRVYIAGLKNVYVAEPTW
jgi:hypothetical protein